MLSLAGKPRGRCAKALKGLCDPAGVIKISDDSSTDSDMGLDSDFNSSPESMFEMDDVIFVEHTYNGFVAEDRSKRSSSAG